MQKLMVAAIMLLTLLACDKADLIIKEKDMGKFKTIPSGSPYEIGNSDIGEITNYDPNAGTFTVSKITISDVRNVIGENNSNLAELCQSPNVNRWALFRPNGNSPYLLSDFGGYNHEANPTTYFATKPVSGTYGIYWSELTQKASVGLGYPLKRGERPPQGLSSWEYVRLKCVCTGDVVGTFYSDVKPATITYEPHTFSIELPDRSDADVNMVISAIYTNAAGNYLADVEDEGSPYSIVSNLRYTIVYTDAPSTLADYKGGSAYKVYYTIRTGITNPVITTQVVDGDANSLFVDGTVFDPNIGILKDESILPDISDIGYGRSFKKIVLYHNNAYWQISDPRQKFKYLGDKYQYPLTAVNQWDNWYEVKRQTDAGYNHFANITAFDTGLPDFPTE